MIKVLHVISDTNIGGAGKVILNFLSEYDREQFDVKVLMPKGSKLKDEVSQLKTEVIEIEGIADQSLDIKAIGKIKKIIKEENPDIVHSHASVSAKMAARCEKKKSIYTRHSVFSQSKKLTRFPGKQINGFLNGFLSDKIIAVAEAAKENLTDTGISEKKIEVILNGVKPIKVINEDERKNIRKKYGFSEDDFIISIIARLDKVKGHQYLIEAAKILKDEKDKDERNKKEGEQKELSREGLSNIKFLIAGTGSEEKGLRDSVKDLDLTDTVIFTGFVKEINEITNITDMIINCSFGTEATSLALLEAMSLGIPAVVTDFGGNADVVEDGQNGFVVPVKAPQSMIEAILKMVQNDKLYGEMSANAKRIYNEKFTAKVMTEKTQNLYKQLIKK